LTLDEYKQFADKVGSGLKQTIRLLAREKVFDARSLPYGTQLIPLSTICAVIGGKFDQDTVKNKIAQWYWSGVFGELYGGANETRFAFDVPEVIDWINGGQTPRTLRDASFSPNRLLSMQTRLSAAYKGLMALLMQAGSLDIMSGDKLEINNYFDMAIDIHHIFPKAYCINQGLAPYLWNSSVNKATLSARTNRIIGGKAPSTYVSTLERDYSISSGRLDDIYDVVFIDKDIKDDISIDLIPRGSTALLDAVGRTIASVGEKLTAIKEDDRPNRILFFIITDGMENASKEYTFERVKEQIKHQREVYSWDFLFLGTTEDALFQREGLGIGMKSARGFDRNAASIANAFQAVSDSYQAYKKLDRMDAASRSSTFEIKPDNKPKTPTPKTRKLKGKE
jgi:hypothetical protein